VPKEIPVIEMRTAQEGPLATLDLLVQGFRLVGALADLQGFDPGRPHVPEFGRKLYHLPPVVRVEDQPAPVAGKLAHSLTPGDGRVAAIVVALGRFIERLRMLKLGGLVMDYDGTLCGRSERFGDLRPDLASECRRLLEGGMLLGVATGRGRSVQAALQKALPRRLWPDVVVGYYNGGDISTLDKQAPRRDASLDPSLNTARTLLSRDPLLSEAATLTIRRQQITIEPNGPVATRVLASHVMSVLDAEQERGVRVAVSSHSVDVLAPGVSKLAVVEAIQRRVADGTSVLSIGDKGDWPGNDYSLLARFPSLSVDEVSASLETCWNIAPLGMSGPDAALRYLLAIRLGRWYARVDTSRLWRES
jgi:hypothetical protein